MKKQSIFDLRYSLSLFCWLILRPAVATDLEWHLGPLKYETLSADVNMYYHIVGFQKDQVGQIIGRHPAYSSYGHDFYTVSGHPDLFIETEDSADGNKICRFRFVRKSTASEARVACGSWQIKNLRLTPSDLDTVSSIESLRRYKDPFAMPFESMAFTPELWKKNIEDRSALLFDLAHKPLVGLNRSSIVGMLGSGESAAKVSSEYPAATDSVDRYIIQESHIGNPEFFEIAYKDHQVIGYRLTFSKKREKS